MMREIKDFNILKKIFIYNSLKAMFDWSDFQGKSSKEFLKYYIDWLLKSFWFGLVYA